MVGIVSVCVWVGIKMDLIFMFWSAVLMAIIGFIIEILIKFNPQPQTQTPTELLSQEMGENTDETEGQC